MTPPRLLAEARGDSLRLSVMGDEKAKNSLVTRSYDQNQPLDLVAEAERVREYVDEARSANTKRAYEADWRVFEAWCAPQGVRPEDAEPFGVARYLTFLAAKGRKAHSIERAYAGIAFRLRKENPGVWPRCRRPECIEEVLSGIRRKHGVAVKRKRAVTLDLIPRMVQAVPLEPRLLALRNRALFLTGVMGGFRRSELVALDVEHIVLEKRGAAIHVGRSKTDQEGAGRVVGIVRGSVPCAVRALEAWLEARGAVPGPLFLPFDPLQGTLVDGRLDARMVALLVKGLAAAVGLDPANYAAHSLRAGLITNAARKKKSIDAIMRQTGHKRVEQVLEYIRHESIFDDNVTEGLL